MPQNTNSRTLRGFTLIELLIVVAVIAVLIGLLLPALAKARDSANRAACGGNMRSLGQILESYKGDNDARYPLAKYMPEPWLSGDENPPITRALASYVEPDSKMYHCPGDHVVHDFPWVDADGQSHISGMSYLFITDLAGRTFEETMRHRRLDLDTAHVAISHDFDGGTFETQDGQLVPVDFFHTKRNILFVDGHVGNRAR